MTAQRNRHPRVSLLENMEMIKSTPRVISWSTNVCDPSKSALKNNFPLWECGAGATQGTGQHMPPVTVSSLALCI